MGLEAVVGELDGAFEYGMDSMIPLALPRRAVDADDALMGDIERVDFVGEGNGVEFAFGIVSLR